MIREDIEQLNVLVPYCFETDLLEEHWYNIGLKHGLEIADEELILKVIGMMLEKNRGVMNYCLAKTPMDLAYTGGAVKKITGKHL